MNNKLAAEWHNYINAERYAHRFSWMGVPIIQEPQDIVAVQELIWKVKPTLIIETGIAHGGSLLLSASMLAMLNYEHEEEREVIGLDIDIREPTKKTMRNHPFGTRVTMIEGDSVSEHSIEHVRERAEQHKRIMVFLDSMHTHDHVLKELRAYAPLVSVGSYCVVFDTGIEDLPQELQATDRPWGKGNNPKTAVHEFLKDNIGFMIDSDLEKKLIVTSSPDGWLKRVW